MGLGEEQGFLADPEIQRFLELQLVLVVLGVQVGPSNRRDLVFRGVREVQGGLEVVGEVVEEVVAGAVGCRPVGVVGEAHSIPECKLERSRTDSYFRRDINLS